ncbi:DUF433 domain-containing protein [Pseudonocardia asaccharolytica]|uniref:DUF433 domain-containing protein n=1 Tax=Pseudonocardia asaccharolytica DSM 44247 = NBRC 16224 TaxID=1123024 RepID=A0A511CYW5_9PSEU|nr:DUF433 domain-containing protein [Pseudonocardia asaccharolytica]GEL17667.1 hypothetical protein PA7_15040 [Pseudonocardia asaccharolytica DSM 44247 = NBRC 16224]
MPETTRDLVGTVRVHPDDDPTAPDARRIIRGDEGVWRQITGSHITFAILEEWRVQPLPDLARILGHPDPAVPGSDELLIVTHPARRGGRPTIGHTRLDVATIWEWLAAGETVEQICRAYPHVTAGQVRVVEALHTDLTDDDDDDDEETC